jgi:hypothetical protein
LQYQQHVWNMKMKWNWSSSYRHHRTLNTFECRENLIFVVLSVVLLKMKCASSVMLWRIEWQAVNDVSKIVLPSKSAYLSLYMECPSLLISLLNLLHTARTFLRSQPVLSYPKNSTRFMETEGSSPYSQQLDICSYPEPD